MAGLDITKQPKPIHAPKAAPLGGLEPGFTGHNDDVADVAAGYMAKDSRLMQGARARGAAFANSRGMLNSSLAAQSGEAAALEQVVPMAGQTAGQNFQKNASGIRYKENRGLAEQGFEHNTKLAEQGFGHQTKLSEQGFRHDTALTAQRGQLTQEQARLEGEIRQDQARLDAVIARDQIEQQGRISKEQARLQGDIDKDRARLQASLQQNQTRLQAQMEERLTNIKNQFAGNQAAYDRALQKELQSGRISFEAAQAQYERDLKARLQSGQIKHETLQAAQDRALKREALHTDSKLQRERMGLDRSEGALERSMKERIAKLDIKGNEQRGVEAFMSNAFRDFEEAQRSILENEKIPAEERNKLLTNAKDMLQRKVDFTEQLYGSTYNWPKNPFKSFAAPAPPPAPKPKPSTGSGGTSGTGRTATTMTDAERRMDQSK